MQEYFTAIAGREAAQCGMRRWTMMTTDDSASQVNGPTRLQFCRQDQFSMLRGVNQMIFNKSRLYDAVSER